MEWRSWTDLGGELKAGSQVSIAGSYRRDLSIAARLANGRVGVLARSTAGWFAWQDMGLACIDAPAITVHQGRMILAARGTDNGLWIGGFQHWAPSGGNLASAPSIAAWRMDGNVEIFARGSDGKLLWFSFPSYGAARLNPLVDTQGIAGRPAAIAPGPNGIHVVVRSEGSSRLLHRVWDYQRWSAWSDLGEVVTSSPCVASREPGSLDVYFADTSGALVRRRYRVDAHQRLQADGGREVLAPAVLGDPAAVSLGPWHAEVFQRNAQGRMERLHAEGLLASDDVGLDLAAAEVVDSAPSMWAQAQDVVVCAGRNPRDELVTITAQDGYWGGWENHGGYLDSDPVIVARLPSTYEVVGRGDDQQLVRWTCQVNSWGRAQAMPAAPQRRWCIGQPRAFSDWQGGVRVITRLSNNVLHEAVIGPDGSFKGWNALDFQSGTQAAEVVQVPEDALPAPFANCWPRVGMPAGTWVLVPDGASGSVRGQFLGGNGWGQVVSFAGQATTVLRPIPVMQQLGFPYAASAATLPTTSKAGWIGRNAQGRLVLQSMAWTRQVAGRIAAIVLDSTPWTPAPGQAALLADPTGVQYPEPFGDLPAPVHYLVTHVFGRLGPGSVYWTTLDSSAPATQAWQWVARDFRIRSDVAPLAQWSSYENRHLLLAAAVTTSNTLLVGVGGQGPAPQRTQPQPTIMLFPRPPMPLPRPIH